MDIDIKPGEDFVERIRGDVGSCDVLVALMGPQWVSIADQEGHRRLDDPEDYPRIEVHSALERANTQVIPVLVGGAKMPTEAELPEPLRALARRQAIEIRDSTWEYDLDRLVAAVEEAVGIRREPQQRAATAGRRRLPLLAGAAAAVVIAAVVVALVAAGGGSGHNTRLSATAFNTKLNSLCSKYQARNGRDRARRVSGGEVLALVDQEVSDFIAEARKIEPPTRLASTYNDYVTVSTAGARDGLRYERLYLDAGLPTGSARAAFQQKNRALLSSTGKELGRARALERKLGIGECITIPLLQR